MFYTYILISEKDDKFYVGYTDNLKRRIKQHNNGDVESTKYRRPLKLIYYEVCLNQKDAIHREKYRFKLREGFSLDNLRLPQRIFETPALVSEFDEAFIRAAVEHVNQSPIVG